MHVQVKFSDVRLSTNQFLGNWAPTAVSHRSVGGGQCGRPARCVTQRGRADGGRRDDTHSAITVLHHTHTHKHTHTGGRGRPYIATAQRPTHTHKNTRTSSQTDWHVLTPRASKLHYSSHAQKTPALNAFSSAETFLTPPRCGAFFVRSADYFTRLSSGYIYIYIYICPADRQFRH